MPTLSIIIVHYNTPNLLNDCLLSIQKYCSEITYEIIIIDNASSQKPSLENLKKLNFNFKNFRIISNPTNVGFAKANNQGAKIAKGDILFLLNSDTYLVNNSIMNALERISKDESIGIIGPKLLNKDLSTQFYGSILNRNQFKKNNKTQVSFLSGAAMFIRKDLFKEVKGFDEKFFFYNEDLDLCKKISSSGKKLIYEPEISLVHLGGASTKLTIKLQKQALLSSWYYFKKWYLKLKL